MAPRHGVTVLWCALLLTVYLVRGDAVTDSTEAPFLPNASHSPSREHTIPLPSYYGDAVGMTRMYYYLRENPGNTLVPDWIPLIDYGAVCLDSTNNYVYYGAGSMAIVSQDPATLELTLRSTHYAWDYYISYCYFPNVNQGYFFLFSVTGDVDVRLRSRLNPTNAETTVISLPNRQQSNPLTNVTTAPPSADATTSRARSIPGYNPEVTPFPRRPLGLEQSSLGVLAYDNGGITFLDPRNHSRALTWTRLAHIVQIAPHPLKPEIFFALGYTNVDAQEWTVWEFASRPNLTGYDGDSFDPAPGTAVLEHQGALSASVLADLAAQCSGCLPVAFTAFDDGLALVMSSEEANTLYVTVVPEPSPLGADGADSDRSFARDASSPYLTKVGAFVDEVCNVSFVMHDTYTNSLLVSMTCTSYGSQLVLVTLADLRVVAHLTLSLPGSMTKTVGLSGIVDSRSRTVKLLVPRRGIGQGIMDVSLVVAASVTPSVVVEGSTVFIHGHGFVPRMVCFFPDHNNTFADIVFHNQTLVECVVPPVVELVRHTLRLQLQLMPSDMNGAADMPQCKCSFLFQPVGNLSILQLRQATPLRVTECTTGNTFGSAPNLCLRVMGHAFGEPDIAPNQRCKLYSEVRGTPAFITKAVFVSTRELICNFTGVTPLPTPTRVAVAIDGALFSRSGPRFSVLGYPTQLIPVTVGWRTDLNYTDEEGPTTLEVAVWADTVTVIPPIVLAIADETDHVIWPMDFDGALDGIVVAWVQKSSTVNSALSEPMEWGAAALLDENPTAKVNTVRGTSRVTVTSNGTVTFRDLVMDCPRVATLLLEFSVVEVPKGLEALLETSVLVTVTVQEGHPYALSFVRQPSSSVSPSVPYLKIQPIIGVVDICDNVFRTLSTTDVDTVDIVVQSYSFVTASLYTTRWSLSPLNNLYYATNVSVKGIQNTAYTVSAESPGLVVPQVSANRVRVEWCDANRLANLDTGECIPCPAYAECNGTAAFLLQDGWWRAGEGSSEFLNCRRLYDDGVCLRDGACKQGYTGIRCAQCESGYRRVSTACAACPSKSLNDLFVFLLCLFYLLMGLGWAVLMTVLPPNSPLVWACKNIILIIQFTGLYNGIALSWTNTARQLFAGTYSLSGLTQLTSACSMSRVGSFVFLFVMPIVLWCVLAIVGRLVVLVMRFDRLDARSLVAIVIKVYSHKKSQEFVALRRDIVGRYLPSQNHNDTATGRHSTVGFTNVNGAGNVVTGGGGGFSGERRESSTRLLSQGAGPSLMSHRAQEEAFPFTALQELEARVVGIFEDATGIHHRSLTDVQLCDALRNLSDAHLDRVSRIQLPLPTRAEVELWTRARAARQASTTALSSGAREHGTAAASGLDTHAHTTVSVEETYRLLAVRQFRTNWLGMGLNEFALIMIVLYLPMMTSAFQWQRCVALNYGVNDKRYVAYTDNSVSCDSHTYYTARDLGIVAIVLYGVVAPLALLALTVHYRRRYGLDVSVAVFPALHDGLPARGHLYEFAVFAEKFIIAIAVVFSIHSRLQAATLVWVVGARMLFDAFTSPYPSREGDIPSATNMWGLLPLGRVMRWTNGLLLLMANMVLIAAFISQNEASTFTGAQARLVTALLIIFFSLALLLNVWIGVAYSVIFFQQGCGKLKRSNDLQRDATFHSLISSYARLCATVQFYTEVCERGLEVALQLDRIKKLNEDSPIDNDLMQTLAEEEEDMLAGGSSLPHRTSTSAGNWANQSSHTANNSHNTLSQGMRSGTVVRSFLQSTPLPSRDPPIPAVSEVLPPTLMNAALVVSDEPANDTAAGTSAADKSEVGITSTGVNAADATTPSSAQNDGQAAADVAAQFANIPTPCPQPALHRRASSLFSVRNLDKETVGGSAQPQPGGTTRGSDVPPILAGLIPFGGTPPPQAAPPTPAVGFQAFSQPPLEVDVASSFDPFRVRPLAGKQRRRQRPTKPSATNTANAAGSPARQDNRIAAELEALELETDVVVHDGWLDLPGIDVSEMRGMLDSAQISYGRTPAAHDTASIGNASAGVDHASPRSPQLLQHDSPVSLVPLPGVPLSQLTFGTSEATDDARPPAPPLPTFRTVSVRPQARPSETRRTRSSTAQKPTKHRSSSRTKKK